MNGTEPEAREPVRGAASIRALEVVVALAIMALGGIVMVSNYRLGAQWTPDGPQAGYFPFYVGLLMFVASAVVFVRALAGRVARGTFVTMQQFRLVIALLLPTAIYVVAMAWIGIYVASLLYLGYFMRVHGRFGPQVILPVAIGIPVALFFLFEVWFLIPLPKGPLESWLGY